MMEREMTQQRDRDINQIVRTLTGIFNQVTASVEKPNRSPKTGANIGYKLQTEFAYLLNEIMVGPKCLLQRNITACNEFIDHTVQLLEKNSVANTK